MEKSANGLRLLLTDDLERFKGLRSLRSLTCAPLTSLVAATGGSTNKVLRKSSLGSEDGFHSFGK